MIELKFVEIDHPALLELVQGLDAFFAERYGETALEYQKYHDLNKMACAAVAYVDGVPAACCCWKPMDAVTAVIKRMYVRPEFRKQGLARLLIEAMEQHAAASGCHRAVLETGADMKDAIAAYTHMGYRECERYGDFVNDTKVVCMEKTVSDGTMR